MIDLNVKGKTVKIMEDNRRNLELGYADAFLDTTSKTQFMREIINKVDLLKMKNFCSPGNNIRKSRRKSTD